MAAQKTLPLHGKGISKTKSGHLRYRSPKEKRNKYVHRDIVEQLIEETPYSLRLYIPWPYEVHHMDYNKEHNAPENFLILPEAFHAKMTADRRRDDGGRFGRKYVPLWKPAPDFVQQRELDYENAVPF